VTPALDESLEFDLGVAELHALIRVVQGKMTHRQFRALLRSERRHTGWSTWSAEDARLLSDTVRRLAEVRVP
jgi:hypothetical protein